MDQNKNHFDLARKSILNDEIDKALDILVNELHQKDELILLKTRYQSYQEKTLKSIISNEQASIEKNQIVNDFLTFISKVSKEDSGTMDIATKRSSSISDKAFIICILGIILFMILIWLTYQEEYTDEGFIIVAYPRLRNLRMLFSLSFCLLVLYSGILLVGKFIAKK